jgi:hypothetical protein
MRPRVINDYSQPFTVLGLRKVTDDMKTHKNPSLRSGPQPFKPSPAPKPAPHAPKPGVKTEQAKPAKCALEGKKWVVVSELFLITTKLMCYIQQFEKSLSGHSYFSWHV